MRSAILRAAAAAAFTAMAFAQAFQDDPGDFIKQGQALTRQGKFDDALQVYRNALQLNPNSYDANSAAGVALDLKGDYAEARKRFESAIQGSSGAQRVRALRDMVISYGFQGLCKEAEPYGRQAYNLQLEAKDYYGAGEVANELARVCIDSGDLDAAEKWYRTGYETGMKQPDIKPDRRNLWEFRREHALGRLAARRGNREEARKHVDAARAILAKGDNPQQLPFLPYLEGYVAFYGGDYKAALSRFQDANQNDAFIAAMMAQTYEKLGDKESAIDYYRRAMSVTAHNPTVAYARPLARKRLGA
jgi:tetratricopeptide (TPR) repeat protein